MRRPRYLSTAIIAAAICTATACSRNDPALAPAGTAANAARFLAAEIQVDGTGGIAALSTHTLLRHDSGSFVFVRRAICAGANCAAPLDSASGTLGGAATDSLFAQIERSALFDLADDYGATVGGADMVSYTVRVQLGGRTKTIRADDGTMPEALRRVDDAIREAISVARR
jgi:hypothetical protein